MSGKKLRLKRLFTQSGRIFAVPMDHGVTVGPVKGLEDIRGTVKAVIEGGAGAVIIHKGLVRLITELPIPEKCELIVHLSASTALAPGPEVNKKVIISSVEHAIRLGASAVSIHVNLAGSKEAEMLRDLGLVAEECDKWGLPLLAMMYVRDGSRESEYDSVKIMHAARIAEELGADIVKVNYTGSAESFSRITGAVRIPVVIAGGPKMDSTEDLLAMVADALNSGASGVAIGRNIFQDKNPQDLARAIRSLIDNKN
ncbi:MAG: 2-amino-3,7-dideoxy-D-threo-hept-6-ulosonate synthase [Bacillota bacterium]